MSTYAVKSFLITPQQQSSALTWDMLKNFAGLGGLGVAKLAGFNIKQARIMPSSQCQSWMNF
jgi:hypothetical protein